jgi:hypothetical protein
VRGGGRPEEDNVERSRVAWILCLAGAFGILEACTVVFLRHLVDPAGTQFPHVQFPPSLLRVEQVREACTLLVLVILAWLASSQALARWGAFLVAFGCWDLVYYVALRLGMGWPPGPGAWDLLFLLPVPWYGPVYAPVVVAATMLGCGWTLLATLRRTGFFVVRPVHVAAVAVGGIIILGSFVLPGPSAVVAHRYPLGALLCGEALGLAGFGHAWTCTQRRSSGRHVASGDGHAQGG